MNTSISPEVPHPEYSRAFKIASRLSPAEARHASTASRAAPSKLSAERFPVAACVMSDAQHFTEVTEGMDPCEVVELVRDYFDALFAPVFKYGGDVIDENGDGILAVWTDWRSPTELCARVCSACLEMAQAADRFNATHSKHRLPTRIGADIGPIALADLGPLACLQRRAVGDPVVTSKRLEQLNKDLGTRILVSAAVAAGASAHVFRQLGAFRLRGKRQALRVLELVGDHATIGERKSTLCEGFAHAFAMLEAGDRESAQCAFQALRDEYPEDGATRYYARRCAGKQRVCT